MATKANTKTAAKTPAKKTEVKKAAPAKKTEVKKAAPAKKETPAPAKKVATTIGGKKVVEVVKTKTPPPAHLFPKKTEEKHDYTISEKLKALYDLQQIDSKVDKIRVVRGELPMEVKDLEDEIIGLNTRVKNYELEVKQLEETIAKKKQSIKDSMAMIKKYTGQQDNVKNNREYESLTKEIEFQNLEIQLSEKRIKEYAAEIINKNLIIEATQTGLDERKQDLSMKKKELSGIIAETEKEEEQLMKKSSEAAKIIEGRLIIAYNKIRTNARNGLAVVMVQRDSCGGCFNKVPAQQQLEIRQRKKVIVCEHCGRILVDPDIIE
jgi:predicted  nucleic acid-binding Zn-ribbon protein